MAVLNELEPKEVFRFFEEISAIPRGSRDTKRISDYLVAFAKERDLKVIQDEVNNVIIFQWVRLPCPNAMAARGAPPPATIAEKAEIKIIREPATPIPASA